MQKSPGGAGGTVMRDGSEHPPLQAGWQRGTAALWDVEDAVPYAFYVDIRDAVPYAFSCGTPGTVQFS